MERLREDLGDSNFEAWARIAMLPREEQQAALAARENASTRLIRRGASDVGSRVRRCSYCPSQTPVSWTCADAGGCSQTVCFNCIHHVNNLPSPAEQHNLLQGGKFRCEQHGGSVAIPLHKLRTLYTGASSSMMGVAPRALCVGVYTQAGDPHGWREVVEKAGFEYVQLKWTDPRRHGDSELLLVILDYHSEGTTGHAEVHETGRTIPQAEMLSRFATAGTKAVVPLTCGGYRLQMRDIERISLEQYPQVQFLLFGLSRLLIDQMLKHLVVQVLKDTQLHGLASLEDALKVHFSSELARVYEPALLQGGRLGGVSINQPVLLPTTINAQMMEGVASTHHDDGSSLYQAIRRPRGRRVGPRLPGGHPYNAVGSQLSDVEQLSSASATERVHFKVLEKLPVNSLGFYLQAQVVTVGKCLLAFTCRGIAGLESEKQWRDRTSHIDEKLKNCRVKLLTIDSHDVEHIVRAIGRVEQLRTGKLDVSRRKVWRLENPE